MCSEWGAVKCAQDVAMYPADSFVHMTLNSTQCDVSARSKHDQFVHVLLCVLHALCSQVTECILPLLHRTIWRCVRSILCFVVKDVGRRCQDDW